MAGSAGLKPDLSNGSKRLEARMSFAHRAIVIAASAGLVGCETIYAGPGRYTACLSDARMSAEYMASHNPYRMLVAGTGSNGVVQCYWSEDDKIAGLAVTAKSWRTCRREANNCAIVAIGAKTTLSDTDRVPQGPDPAVRPVFVLLGQFAQGVALGMGAAVGAQVTSGPRSVAPLSGPPREAIYGAPQTLCTPTGGNIGGYPNYVCR